MKEVVNRKTDTIQLSDINPTHLFGISCGANRYLVIKNKDGADGEEYTTLDEHMIYSPYPSSLNDILFRCLANDSKVYQFDSLKEAHKWFAENI
jgi:hypothetical protein